MTDTELKLIAAAVAFGAERGCFVHGHSADGVTFHIMARRFPAAALLA